MVQRIRTEKTESIAVLSARIRSDQRRCDRTQRNLIKASKEYIDSIKDLTASKTKFQVFINKDQLSNEFESDQTGG